MTQTHAEPAIDPAAEPRRITPIKWWAALGIGFFALEAYILGSWFASGNVKRTPIGSTPVPSWMRLTIEGYEVLGLVIAAVFIFAFLAKPWLQEKRITLDGMLVIVFLTMYWQDLLGNYFQPWVTYNAAAINFGSWFGEVPGWNTPNGHLMVEPFIWVFPVYAYIMFGFPVLGCFVMRKVHERRPTLGRFGLAASCFSFMVALDLILEPGMMRLGLFAYGGSVRWLTLFPGHYYQFPLYEAFWFPLILTVWASIRYFRNDKGQTLAERGLEHVAAVGGKQTCVRFLALAGLLNLTFLLLYSLPIALTQLKADSWPADVQNRSYFTNEVCGPGTAYACPGPGTPIPRPGSAHLDPAGRLVSP